MPNPTTEASARVEPWFPAITSAEMSLLWQTLVSVLQNKERPAYLEQAAQEEGC